MAVKRTDETVIIHIISTGKCNALIFTARSKIESVNATMNENIIKVQHGVSFWEFSASRIAGIVMSRSVQSSVTSILAETSLKTNAERLKTLFNS